MIDHEPYLAFLFLATFYAKSGVKGASRKKFEEFVNENLGEIINSSFACVRQLANLAQFLKQK